MGVGGWARAHIYSATQTAVRTVVAGMTMEALLTQRVAIGAQLRRGGGRDSRGLVGGRAELIAAQAEAVGVQVHAVEVRDVMLPGELRKAFSEVLKAKQEGQAALERARGERHAREAPTSNAERKLHSRRSGNPPRCATSRTRRASSKASRRSRRSASCKRSKRPMRARLW